MSLLWCVAVTTLLVLLQWPPFLQWLVVIGWGVSVKLHSRRPSFSIDASKELLHWRLHGDTGVLSLLYQTELWSVLILHSDPRQPLLRKLLHYLCRYRWLYRDQLSDADYRYLRSRLNVEKLLALPIQKSESEVSK